MATVNIYRQILTKKVKELVYKDVINTIALLLERTRDIITKINSYIDINNNTNPSKNSNDETLVNIRVTLPRLGFNKRFIIIRSNKGKLVSYLYKS